MRHLAELADGFLYHRLCITDKGHADHRTACIAQRLERQQRVVDRAQLRPRAEDHGGTPTGEEVEIQHLAVQGHHQPACPFGHQHAINFGQGQRIRVDLYPFGLSRQMRRCGQLQQIALRQRRTAGQARDDLAVGFFLQPRLHRLPIGCAKSLHQPCGKDGLADAGIGSGDDQAGH